MEVLNSPYMAPCTPSPDPRSNTDVHELESWLSNQFKCSSIPDAVECVPASSLLKSLNNPTSSSAQESVPCTEEKVFEQCRLRYLDILGYHFDEHSVGGSFNFLSLKFLIQAFIEAQTQSAQLCKKLCDDSKHDKLTITRLGEKLKKFVADAQAKTVVKNHNNCLRYLERNKKNVIQKFCDVLKDKYKFLYQPDERSCEFEYYNSKKLADELKEHISKIVASWNNIKSRAISDLRSQDPSPLIRQPEYNDDVEKTLNAFLSEIVTSNKKRNGNYLHRSVDRRLDMCKKNIEQTVNTTKYLDEITHEDINVHVTTCHEQFLTEMKVEMEDVGVAIEQQLKCKLQEKEKELLNYGHNLLKQEIDKGREAMHLEGVIKIKAFIEQQQKTHRLKRIPEIYQEHILAGFRKAKRHCDSNGNGTNSSDEENTGIAASSQGASREPLSVSSSARSNVASGPGQNYDMNESRNNDSNVNMDDNRDSDESNNSSPPKRHKKHRSSREKGKSKRSSKKSSPV